MKSGMILFVSLLALPSSLALAKPGDAHIECAMGDSVLRIQVDISSMTLSGPFRYQGINPGRPPVTGIAVVTNNPDEKILHMDLDLSDGKKLGTLVVDTTNDDSQANNGTLAIGLPVHLGCGVTTE